MIFGRIRKYISWGVALGIDLTGPLCYCNFLNVDLTVIYIIILLIMTVMVSVSVDGLYILKAKLLFGVKIRYINLIFI